MPLLLTPRAPVRPAWKRAGRSAGRAKLSFLAVLLLLPVPAETASATTIDVPADQPTLKTAVAAASSGDTILFAPGVHEGGVFVTGKALTLASWFLTTGDTTHIAQTVLDGIVGDVCGGDPACSGDAVVELGTTASRSALVGLTLRNGTKGVRTRSYLDISYCHILGDFVPSGGIPGQSYGATVVGDQDGVNYMSGTGGMLRNSLFAYHGDDGIDLNGRIDMTVENNIIRDNHDDGIEFRMYAYSGPTVTIQFLGNQISGNGEDGIQLIDYPDTSHRVIRIERNIFRANFDASGSSAAIGCMPDGMTKESLVGAPMPERLLVINNTFIGESNGLVGGANAMALNNVFTGTLGSALRRVGGGSIASFNLLWSNGIDHEESNLDLPNTVFADPELNVDATLTARSPGIDGGTAFFQWQGETILDLPPASYLGNAPDLGALEFRSDVSNLAPAVEAGASQVVALPSDAVLDATVIDDGRPVPPAFYTVQWTRGSGPGPVTFEDPAAVDTRASFITAGVYVLRLTAYDGELSTYDSVQVEVLPQGPAVVERRVGASSDDAEEVVTGGVNIVSTDLELVFDTSDQRVGLRFTDVTVPPGATIVAAYLQFAADETQSDPTHLVIQGQAADDAATFVATNSNVSARPRTTAAVDWWPPAWTQVNGAGPDERTPDLSAVIQEIIDRPGWVHGNALAIIITGTGHRTARAFDWGAAVAPLLHVEYTTPTAGVGDVGAPRGFALHGVRPNPARGVLGVEFSLVEAGPATLEVLDLAGRRIASREVGSLGPSRHRLELREPLPAGVYVVRLVQGGRRQTAKAVVLE